MSTVEIVVRVIVGVVCLAWLIRAFSRQKEE